MATETKSIRASSDRNCRVLVTGGSGFIGRHLVEHLVGLSYQVTNYDIVAPEDACQVAYWRQGDILNMSELAVAIHDLRPQAIIHLAALAVMEGKSLDDFKANTVGTSNLLTVVKGVAGVERVVITSSQHVRRPGSGAAKHDEDYDPLMLYGESKVVAERHTRSAGLPCHWTIIRPTLVWGPHHPFQVDGLWRLMAHRKYVHPTTDPVIRAYGYVRNVVWQIERIIALPGQDTHGRTLYVGDENMRQCDWINAFSLALTGKRVRTVPRWCIKSLSIIGDCVRACGLSFPMYSARFSNLTTSNAVPMDATFKILGKGPYTFEQAVASTTAWLKEHYRMNGKNKSQ